jgi:hypothetical protein
MTNITFKQEGLASGELHFTKPLRKAGIIRASQFDLL